ncbi:MAG: pyridoxamine 5'-phosphate oxidase [Ginsengibacter sp.]
MGFDKNITELRKDYLLQTLSESEVSSNPIVQFEKWWLEAIKSEIEEINAMTLATCNSKGQPSARVVLLKDFSEEGFIFFTNYNSRKGKDLSQNPFAALVFFWKELERQVRIEGSVKKISESDSDEYFLTRPQASRLGAWSSPQSSFITDREILEKNVEYYLQFFNNGDIPRPGYWGGYIIKPSLIEFWQGRPGRLHDRIQYIASDPGWQINRLAP